jgi:hypothetical protein
MGHSVLQLSAFSEKSLQHLHGHRPVHLGRKRPQAVQLDLPSTRSDTACSRSRGRRSAADQLLQKHWLPRPQNHELAQVVHALNVHLDQLSAQLRVAVVAKLRALGSNQRKHLEYEVQVVSEPVLVPHGRKTPLHKQDRPGADTSLRSVRPLPARRRPYVPAPAACL